MQNRNVYLIVKGAMVRYPSNWFLEQYLIGALIFIVGMLFGIAWMYCQGK